MLGKARRAKHEQYMVGKTQHGQYMSTIVARGTRTRRAKHEQHMGEQPLTSSLEQLRHRVPCGAHEVSSDTLCLLVHLGKLEIAHVLHNEDSQ
jgi:hypothetical protein